ncbi:AEC family transporter [Anaerovibrio sp.]|uniref:AEC family transporter n=1 Tax=Anaerovibrio sp. TaxID=1872532 RepID=UPI001B53C7A9|nr:AEC family transporter [Anaerovibrio sp.]MBP3232096.1 AEC family transporter [Anaerovibrio sp.]MBR2141747.1 AEC family transporter [Anaerovibrio sp.]
MYNNFIVSLEAVLPIAILIGVGLLAKRMQLLTREEISHVNKLVFKILFFCLLFQNMYNADFSIAFQPQLLLFAFIAILATVAIASVVVCHFVEDNKRRGAMIHSIYRSNFIIIGIPVAANIYGHDNIATTAMLITVVIPLYNILAVTIFETFRGNQIHLKPVLLGIIHNPMILGCLTGILFNLCHLTIPHAILKPIFQIGSATTPLALILLGASFTISSVVKNRLSIMLCSFARLIVAPAIILPIAVWMGYRNIELVSLMTVFAAPCAVVGFTMAQQMDSDYELAGNCIIMTSGLSCFTIFGWIFLGKALGLI